MVIRYIDGTGIIQGLVRAKHHVTHDARRHGHVTEGEDWSVAKVSEVLKKCLVFLHCPFSLFAEPLQR